MVDEEVVIWPKEDIPDDDLLYLRAHRRWLDEDALLNAFRDHDGGMSTDWSKWSSPQETLARAKEPAVNAVMQLSVGDVRSIRPLTVEHSPVQPQPILDLPGNRAHTDVIGKKDQEVRLKLLRIHEKYGWAIAPPWM